MLIMQCAQSHISCNQLYGGDAMVRQDEEGDAYPDPRKARPGNKIKAVVCISLLLICLSSLITSVAAPGDDDFPDPLSVPDPIFSKCPITNLSEENPVKSQPILMME